MSSNRPLYLKTPQEVLDDDSVVITFSFTASRIPVNTEGPAVPGREILSGAFGRDKAVSIKVGEVSTEKTN